MSSHQGGCLCGAIRYEVTAELIEARLDRRVTAVVRPQISGVIAGLRRTVSDETSYGGG